MSSALSRALTFLIMAENKGNPNPGIFAGFKLHPVSIRRLREWAIENKIQNVFPPEEFHITTVFTKEDIPYKPIGELKKPSPCAVLGYELFGDNGNVLVVKVSNPLLDKRWQKAMDMGMKKDWKYEGYTPHVTISTDNSLTKEDVANLPLIDFPVFITEEYSQPHDPPDLYKVKADAIEYILAARTLGKRLTDTRGKDFVLMFRACAVSINTFKPMDYVTLSSKFAKGHADHMAAVEDEPYHVIKKVVSTDYLYEAGNPGEYFYNGKELKGTVIYTANEA